MLCIVSFMPQKIPVCPRVKECLVAVFGFLPNRKGNGTVWIERLDGADDADQALIRIIAVLSALQDEGAKAQFIAGVAAGEYVFLC